MLFNSYAFIFIFLPITFFTYFALTKKNYLQTAKAFLVAASLFFYSWWNVIYLPLILGSILFNYYIGGKISRRKTKKKLFLLVGIAFNIALLGYFKYADFFIANLNFAFDTQMSLLHLALPLAISFFTFQQVAYLVDSYRGETQEYDFLNYCVFVTFFPQLIAGPIVHHKEMMPQFADKGNTAINYNNIAIGLFIFSVGLFKKVVIADSFAVWATSGFATPEVLTFFEAWGTSLSYTFQLYFDFSGYTDMAIGLALLFNITLPANFNSPYKATNIQDFWRRWHMTLSRFLRDYIYIPLGGSRTGKFRTYFNLMATFIIGGFWHGAGWTFIFWGFLHGLALVIHRFWQKLGYKMHAILAWFITFNFINVAWVFFRAESWQDAISVLKGMFDITNIAISKQFSVMFNYINPFYFFDKTSGIKLTSTLNIYTLEMILVGFILTLVFHNTNSMFEKKYHFYSPIYYAVLFMFTLLWMSISTYSEFIYFNF